MILTTLLDDYLLRARVSRGQELNYRSSLAMFAGYLGHAGSIDDLRDDVLSRYLAAIERAGHSLWTVRQKRNTLLTLWRFAFAEHMIDRQPVRVRKIPKPASRPQSWTIEEMRRLIAAAKEQRGCFRFSGVSRAAFWRAFVLAAYDSGLRMGDLMRLTFANVQSPAVEITQHKTGKPIVVAFGQDTLAAIRDTAPPRRPLIFGFLSRERLTTGFRKLVATAGLHGTSRYLRRTSGTIIEAHYPGLGHLHLGNGRDVFERHYLDQRKLKNKRPLPPRL